MRKKKRLIGWLLCLLTFFCFSVPVFAVEEQEYPTEEYLTLNAYTFADLAAARLSAYGFLPDEYRVPQEATSLPVSRGEAVSLLYRAFGTPPAGSCPFSDVPKQYQRAVTWAYEQGLISGTGPATFGMQDMSRSSFIRIIQRLLNRGDGGTDTSVLGLSTENFTLGDVALMIEEVLSDTSIKNNIPSQIDQLPFPYAVKFSPKSEDELELMLQKAFSYIPKRVVIERDNEFSEESFLGEFVRYRAIQYGLQTNCILVDSWMYQYLYGPNSISAEYQESAVDEKSEKQFDQNEYIQALVEQFLQDEISSEEFDYKLELARANQFGEHSTISLEFTYAQAWKMICDYDNAFAYYIDPSLSATASAFYEQYAEELSGLSDYDLIFAVKRIIMNKASYGNVAAPHVHELAEFFQSGKIVCDAYAQTFQFFMLKEGIPCVTVPGSTTKKGGAVDHDWNKVQLCGKWYNIDICWADTGKEVQYDLKSDAYYETHSHWPVMFQNGIMSASDSYSLTD